MASFLGQDSARYEHGLKSEMEEGALSWVLEGASLGVFLCLVGGCFFSSIP